MTDTMQTKQTKQGERVFRLHWIGGQTEEIKGPSLAEAMTQAGYGAGAVRALDYFEDITGRAALKEAQS